jgi:hypothetical protein
MSTHAAARLAWSRCTLTVTYFPSATDLPTHLRSATLRCGWPGYGPRVGVTAGPTSFGSERFYELRVDGVRRNYLPRTRVNPRTRGFPLARCVALLGLVHRLRVPCRLHLLTLALDLLGEEVV